MKQDEPILVAIHCLVYNHEHYLRDCLEGFVMQKTNFRFVAIVHDDASTDRSADIIREYAEKYPEIFRPIYEVENKYSKRDGSLDRIMNAAIDATGAKYVAMCEGDDYWTDLYKLQKQVDYMESHPDCSLCFHKVSTLLNKTGELRGEFLIKDMPGKSTILQLATGNYIHTPSALFRNNTECMQKIADIGLCFPGDYVVWMIMAETGYIYKMDDEMAVYRYGSGIWTSDNRYIQQQIMILETYNKLWHALSHEEAKKVLLQQIRSVESQLFSEIQHICHNLQVIKHSKAYRIGRFLMAPIHWLKNKRK